MKPYRLTKIAFDDLLDAVNYHSGIRDGLGEELAATVNEAIDLARERPLSFPEFGLGIRRAKTARFPYAVYFTIKDETIVILAVYHASRQPPDFVNLD